jgi:hypothetical protein
VTVCILRITANRHDDRMLVWYVRKHGMGNVYADIPEDATDKFFIVKLGKSATIPERLKSLPHVIHHV